MTRTYDSYTVYLFPNGFKRLSLNLSGLELKQLILRYGQPVKIVETSEEVDQWLKKK